MNEKDEIKQLKENIKTLRAEIDDLKDFVRAMYYMISESEEEYDESSDFLGGAEMGRFNT